MCNATRSKVPIELVSTRKTTTIQKNEHDWKRDRRGRNARFRIVSEYESCWLSYPQCPRDISNGLYVAVHISGDQMNGDMKFHNHNSFTETANDNSGTIEPTKRRNGNKKRTKNVEKKTKNIDISKNEQDRLTHKQDTHMCMHIIHARWTKYDKQRQR